MHKPAFSHLKLQDIIFIIQHGQMNILLNTFPIAIVRQLDIGTISGDYGIFAGNKSEIDDTPVIAQYLECVTGLQSTGNIRNFGYLQRMHQGNQGERHMFPNAYARQVIWQWNAEPVEE